MRTPLIAAAILSGFAVAGSAASFDAPFALTAPHADFLAQLEEAAATPDEIGAAARIAADVYGPHNAAEEAIVMPLLGRAEAAAAGTASHADTQSMQEAAAALGTEFPALVDGQANVVAALVDLYAAAVGQDRMDLAGLAERMIWHETSDAEVLYPAAMLVGAGAGTSAEAAVE